jgi:hypothetical protein
MAEQATMNTPEAEENSVPNPSTQADDKNDVPYTRFQEVNGQKNQFKSENEGLKAENAKLKAAEEDARQQTLKKNSEYETLYNEGESKWQKTEEENKAYKTRELEDRERMIEKVPEEQRVFTEGMSNSVLAQYIEQNQTSANAGKTDSSRAGNTAKGDFNGYSSFSEWATKDPKGYEEVNGIVGNQGNQFNVGG